MLVTSPPSQGLRRWRLATLLGLLLIVGPLLAMLPYLVSGTEAVRLRNALLLAEDLSAPPDWTPPNWPAGFLQESAVPDPYFVAVAQRLQLAALPDDWAKALAISAHLLGSHAELGGGAIQGSLVATHRAIVERGDGYCADFVRAFNAIAAASGLQVRSWAFSFDGFGGHGHVWSELWNRQRQRWQLIDVFDNFYFVDGSDEPLSALEFRKALSAGSASLAYRPLYAAARPGYEIPAKAWDYFRRGLPEWYLWNGNNVFAYDASPLVRSFEGKSRAAAQFGAIYAGVHPALRMLATPANQAQRERMRALHWQLVISAWLAALGLVLTLLCALGWWRSRRALALEIR